jgi:hypothetical protein
MTRNALRAVLALGLCMSFIGYARTQEAQEERLSPEPAYLLACDDQEAVEAVRTTFLMQQWIMVAILAHSPGVSALEPESKQGIGGCVLHRISDPLSFSITGKYVYPLRLPPARFLAPGGHAEPLDRPGRVRDRAPGKAEPQSDIG